MHRRGRRRYGASMLFNSWSFIPFFATVLGLYYVLPWRAQNVMLLVASYVFYGAWDWRFLLLLLFSTSVDYFVGRSLGHIQDERKRKRILLASILTNLLLLGFFKYYNFFVDGFGDLAGLFGLPVHPAFLNVVLPVGISFYTFQSLGYTIDVYRKRIEPVSNPVDLALFVSFFPHLVAGPIQPPQVLIPQLAAPRRTSWAQVQEGLWLILWGLVKKSVVADNLAPYVDRTFAMNVPDGGPRVLLAVYCFALQIYGDFSGYTDIARGISKLLGIEMMLNFNRPYLAENPADLWRRWHISLSAWLRDYLYIPLGGNRKGARRTMINLILTMLLGGLWHGAAWTFVLWGLYHGILLAMHRKVSERTSRLPRLLCVAVMFHLTCFGWLIFRSGSVGQALNFAKAMVTNPTWNEGAAQMVAPLIALGGLVFGIEAWVKNRDNPAASKGWDRGWGPVAVTALVMAVLLFAPPSARSFIYFQF